jgi:hypothetical protein
VALVRERQKLDNRFVNVFAYPVGGIQIVFGYEFPNIVKVCVSFRVKNVAAHD